MRWSGSADVVEAIGGLVEDAEPRCGTTTLICVDGRSGSGKTDLGTRLGEDLDAPVLSLDELLHGWDDLAAVARRARDEVLDPLSRNEIARFRRWDWQRESLGDWHQIVSPGRRELAMRGVPRLVLEGCGAGSRVLAPFTSVLVWLEVPTDERHRRALARDPAYEPFWDRWAAQEDRLYADERPWERADLVVGG